MIAACVYFLLCDRSTELGYVHPLLGVVPTCERCATVAGLPLSELVPLAEVQE